MQADRWQELEELFHAALAVAPEQVDDFLSSRTAEACVRAEVASLVRNYRGSAANPLFPPLLIHTFTSSSSSASEEAAGLDSEWREVLAAGEIVGDYETIRPLGHGGMGAVYLARRKDDLYQKTVAIKVLREGYYSADAGRRFRAEREILASLEHPNIARLLDGGSTNSGLPYFVMDFVEGSQIDVYSNAHHLGVAERVRLFLSVCEAVQHAHQRLIVHRDLKPANILVTAAGEVRLLDFGIAKLLARNEATGDLTPSQTQAGHFALTPEYSSPEQIRGHPVSTTSDIYSLGLVLFKLLTGTLPYQLAGLSLVEAARVVCETTPARPSAVAGNRANAIEFTAARLRKRLAGDLDHIVLKALRKESAARYATVEQLRLDLERFLEGRAVEARNGNVKYRAHKFIQRHWIGIGFLLFMFAALSVGVVATWYQARRAEQQRALAEKRFQDVQKLARSMVFDVYKKLDQIPGATDARQTLISTALTYLGSLSREAQGDIELQEELAQAYERIADVEGSPDMPNMGQTAAAVRDYEKALSLEQSLAAQVPEDAGVLAQLVMGHYKMGTIQMYAGHTELSIASLREGIGVAERLWTQGPHSQEIYRLRGSGAMRLAKALAQNGTLMDALRERRRGLAAYEEWAAAYPSVRSQIGVAIGDLEVGSSLEDLGDLSGALENYEKAAAIRESIPKASPEYPRNRRDLMTIYSSIGNLLYTPLGPSFGDAAAALDYLEKAADIARELYALDAKNAGARYDLSRIEWIKSLAVSRRDTKQAILLCREALAVNEGMPPASRLQLDVRRQKAFELATLGFFHYQLGELSAASNYTEAALTLQQEVARESGGSFAFKEAMIFSNNLIGDIYLSGGLAQKALASYSAALHIAEELAATQKSYSLLVVYDVSSCYKREINYWRRAARTENARTRVLQNRELWRRWVEKNGRSWFSEKQLKEASLFASDIR